MKRILFVCHGNICRSVMAEMVMKKLVESRKEKEESVEWVIDSCATSTEEIGNDIYPPAKRCLSAHGVPYSHHSARQITRQDLEEYDHIYCMDQNNLRNLRRMFGDELTARVRPLMTLLYENQGLAVPDVADPWYTGDFEATYRDVVACCEQILKNV